MPLIGSNLPHSVVEEGIIHRVFPLTREKPRGPSLARRHQILSLAWLPITTHPPQKRSRPQMRCGSALSDKYTQNHKTCKMRVRPELPRRYYSSLLLSITIPVILKGSYTSVLPVNFGVLAVFPNPPPAFFLKSWNSISALLHSQYL